MKKEYKTPAVECIYLSLDKNILIDASSDETRGGSSALSNERRPDDSSWDNIWAN